MMAFHISTQDLILAAVLLHLAASLARLIWSKPGQKAQIDSIESKVDTVLTQVGQAITHQTRVPTGQALDLSKPASEGAGFTTPIPTAQGGE